MRRLAVALPLLIVPVALAHAAQTTTVTASGSSFTPQTVTIAVGDTVEWQNGTGNHNVAFDDGSYRSGDPTTKTPIGERTFTAEGSFKYHCEVHGASGGLGMSGTVVVGAGGAEPTVTPTVTPGVEPEKPVLSSISVKHTLSRGRVRGTLSASPEGAGLSIVVTRRGIVVGSSGRTVDNDEVSFAVKVAQSVRKAVRKGQRPKVRVDFRLESEGKTTRAHRTVRLRD